MNIITTIGIILLTLKIVGVTVGLGYFWIFAIIFWPITVFIILIVGGVLFTVIVGSIVELLDWIEYLRRS